MSTATMFRVKLAARRRSLVRLSPGALRAREIRGFLWAVLGMVAGMIPTTGDIDGCAAGVSSVAEIAERTRLSRNRTRNALAYFRANRILWLRFQAGTVEVKFQRQVVVGLLAAQKVAPLEVRR